MDFFSFLYVVYPCCLHKIGRIVPQTEFLFTNIYSMNHKYGIHFPPKWTLVIVKFYDIFKLLHHFFVYSQVSVTKMLPTIST